jgi:PAS domain S-box-containing protein
MKSRISGKALADGRAGTRSRGKASRAAPDRVRFRRLFETAKDGLIVLDEKTRRILEVNPYLARLLGASRRQLLGKELAEIGILTDEQARREMFTKLKREGAVQFEHTVPASPSVPVRLLELVCNSYRENGRSLIQCNLRDIGERKESERQLREALQQLALAKEELEARVQERTADLRQRNAELKAFSYSLSHDLRAPIRAIVSFTQLALEEYGPRVGPPATEYLEKAVSAARRLDHLILDVLAFSRTTRQKLVSEPVDVEKLLKDILQDRPEWTEPKAKVTIESPLAWVMGDGASLTQCLTNLLDNAIKFLPRGVTPEIRIFSHRSGSRVSLCVADNGIGIPETAQPRIFDLFQRAHNGYEGYGIGLAIVRRAADRMQGTVSVSSVPGKGSTFCLELPAPPQS